jgi:murein DD-endopeptidase MepM/ murein hydrolase activator NlpD
MNRSWIIAAALLVPLLASCSSTKVLVKKKQAPEPVAAAAATVSAKTEAPEPSPDLPAFQQEGAFHIVGAGETLPHICDVYGLDLKKVAAINDLTAPYSLKVGDTIYLPAEALLDTPEKNKKTASASTKKETSKGQEARSAAWNVARAMRGIRLPTVPSLKYPVPDGVLTSPFGHRWGVFHKGLDIAAPEGTDVRACADGKVVFTGTHEDIKNYGRIVVISHGRNVFTQYAHLSKIIAKPGQKVKAGQKIAAVGNTGRSTGPHLHLEVRVANQLYNPLAYISRDDLKGVQVAKRFADSPMGPVMARWSIPSLLTAGK